MRTKALLTAAAALAAGIATSNAQVYSANVVGYVSVTIAPTNFSLISIPLDYDGTGTNDLVGNVFGTNFLNGTALENWAPGSGFVVNTYGTTSKNPTPHWSLPTQAYGPGDGIFVYNPSNVTYSVSIVGTVLQGNLTNQYIDQAGFALIGGEFPLSGGVDSTFGYTPDNGDAFESWSPSSGFTVNDYGTTSKNPTPHWSLGEPQLTPGSGGFIYTTNPAPVMATNFVVNP
jgi:hypothetical protein